MSEPAAPKPLMNPYAVPAFILGLVPTFSLLAILMGFTALRQIHSNKNWQRGEGWAWAGLILGLLWFPLLLSAVYPTLTGQHSADRATQNQTTNPPGAESPKPITSDDLLGEWHEVGGPRLWKLMELGGETFWEERGGSDPYGLGLINGNWKFDPPETLYLYPTLQKERVYRLSRLPNGHIQIRQGEATAEWDVAH